MNVMLAEAPLATKLDAAILSNVVLNLAINARDAMPTGGELIFDVSTVDASDSPASFDLMTEGHWTLLRVADCGDGMSPEVLAHAFEPFYTTKGRDRGTGLGLSTVQGIVTAAGGHIRVSSTVGRGTEFRVYLPAAIEPA